MYAMLHNKTLNQTPSVVMTTSSQQQQQDEPLPRPLVPRPPVSEAMYGTFKGAAIAYCFMYVVGVICSFTFWYFYVTR